ncbi:hypothetical protein A3K63_00180 [Candidatus Micrarchaeota archaeon RBG_16_49_10]|nr:MAG: hypothetical protein A3K63_00180 [Candidatus Micrarchaeota archaeon RBG_16_49_10]
MINNIATYSILIGASVLFLFGIALSLIIFGVIFISKPEKTVKWRNKQIGKMLGVKAETTQYALRWTKINGFMILVLGICIMIGVFALCIFVL